MMKFFKQNQNSDETMLGILFIKEIHACGLSELLGEYKKLGGIDIKAHLKKRDKFESNLSVLEIECAT